MPGAMEIKLVKICKELFLFRQKNAILFLYNDVGQDATRKHREEMLWVKQK